MKEYEHPRVVVGVDGSLSGLAAIRAAVAEARRRGLPLLGVRAHLRDRLRGRHRDDHGLP